MVRSLLVVLAAAHVLCGCDALSSSSADVTFHASASEYAPGDTVGVVLENRSDEGVGYNICSAFVGLDRKGRTWKAAWPGLGPGEGAACQSNLNGLAPGGAIEGSVKLPSDLDTGTYRLATEVEVGRDRQRVATGSFTVR